MSCINVCVIARTQFRALKDAVDAGHPVAVVSDVAAVGDLDAQLFDHAGLLGAGEAHGQQYQLAGDPEVAARDFVEDDTARLVTNGGEKCGLEIAKLVADERTSVTMGLIMLELSAYLENNMIIID